ncbi:hypothetical protein Tco_0422216 [Tanacetum coccineum]
MIVIILEEYDTHDPKGHCTMVLPFLKKRSKIIEIVAARDIVFALAQSGVCAAFSRETNQRICFLNVSPDEVIRSLFYNKNNDSLITVSVYASDSFSSLKCRTTRIEYIRRAQPDAGFALFESESLKWPGFVEFDDVNGKVLTFSAQDSVYKVFDLKNYTLLYSISDKNVQEIKISPGIMLLIYNKAVSHVPLKILSIEDGTVLKSFNHLLHRNKKVDFIEQFNEKLLVKQENENLQILDVRNFDVTEVSRTEFMTPSAFIFLYENQLFLTFRNRTVAVWNFRGELVTSFEDHLLWHPDCNTNNIYITSDQDLIISYCKTESDDPLTEGHEGSINISNILTGKCLAKIKAKNGVPLDEYSCGECSGRSCKCTSRKRVRASRITSSVTEALEDITALFYDEERNEIYTGNSVKVKGYLPESCIWLDLLVSDWVELAITISFVKIYDRMFAILANQTCANNILLNVKLLSVHLALEYQSGGGPVVHIRKVTKIEHKEFLMEGGIGPDVPLDCVQLQIYPTKNRYEACVCSGNRTAKVASGTLEHLLLHSPRVKKLSSKGSRTNIKLLPPENISASEWFTTTTLKRFLHILGLSDILSIGNEIGQLEETRKFQLSLSVKAEVDITSSINSKNELLRAVDLRLIALKDEVAAAFDQAIGGRCSTKDISDLENFAHQFGAKDIRDSLQKFLEMNLFPTVEDSETNKTFSKTETSALGPHALHNLITLIYTSPQKKLPQKSNLASDVISENKKSPNEQRGGYNDHYKQKRDENLKVEAFGKNAEKEAQSKVMQMVSTNVIEPQKTPLTNSRNEPSKPSVLKKNSSKMSNLPATRKSWSSSPAPSHARTPTGPTARSTTPTSRKPQPVLSEVRSTTISEKSQPRSKNLKATASDASRTLKTNNEKKQPTVTKITKTRTPEVNTAAKPSFDNNVTKKSSIVALDTKSFLLKGSGIGPGVGPIGIETKVVGQPEEASRTSETLIEAMEDEVVMTPDISENHEECEAPEYQVVSPTKCEESINNSCDDGFKRIELTEINTGAEEESMISPTAWVEADDQSDNHEEEDILQKGWFDRHEEDDIIPCIESESPVQVVSPVKVVVPAGPSSPRVRRSLSQILLEENSEEADNCEWGNAEHPPSLIYQKDSPKGLKRLLKFARKNKATHVQKETMMLKTPKGQDEREEAFLTPRSDKRIDNEDRRHFG